MHKSGYNQYLFECDEGKTYRNRNRLFLNSNLCNWYRGLYENQFRNLKGSIRNKVILEIGSGTSPLKNFYPHVLTSDVLKLNYIDYTFDCHKIDLVSEIRDHSIDIITVTNVLHHLKDPVKFITKSAQKLKFNGLLIATEPYFSTISTPIYKYLHHESVDFNIKKPILKATISPLSSSNIALPYLIFFSDNDWCQPIWDYFDQNETDIQYYTSLSYMITGGISYRLPIPNYIFKWLFRIDSYISQHKPKLFASFFTIIMKIKSI